MQYVIQISVCCNMTSMLYSDSHNYTTLSEKYNSQVPWTNACHILCVLVPTGGSGPVKYASFHLTMWYSIQSYKNTTNEVTNGTCSSIFVGSILQTLLKGSKWQVPWLIQMRNDNELCFQLQIFYFCAISRNLKAGLWSLYPRIYYYKYQVENLH